MSTATDIDQADKTTIAVEIGEFARFYRAPSCVVFGLLTAGLCAWIAYELVFGLLDTALRLKGICLLTTATAILPRLPTIYFRTVLDTLAKAPCLILCEQGFTDTRVSDDEIAWASIYKIEEWRPYTNVSGLKLTLSQPCRFTVSYVQKFGQSKLLKKYANPYVVHVSLWTLRYNKQELIEEFKRRQQF